MPGPNTRCVHAGERPDSRTGALVVPIHQTTTFRFPELADGAPSDYIYSRYDNPSLQSVEEKVASLEGADGAYLFASGMGAIQAACLTVLKPGDVLAVQQGCYGGTMALFHTELERLGIRVEVFHHRGGELPDDTRLLWLESITNPLLDVADIEAWAARAHAAEAVVAVDATFASPILQRPLHLGADMSIHSATKYLNGHADVTAGVVATGEELLTQLWERRRNLGATLDPHAAYLVGRGIKTLGLRLREQCANAQALAEFAADHARVEAVHYPGLADHPDHATARRLLNGGFGGMLTLDLGSFDAARALRRRVGLFAPAASLGGVESLISLPLETSHAYTTAEDRHAQGVTDGLVRLSVGIEDIEDLKADLSQALAAG